MAKTWAIKWHKEDDQNRSVKSRIKVTNRIFFIFLLNSSTPAVSLTKSQHDSATMLNDLSTLLSICRTPEAYIKPVAKNIKKAPIGTRNPTPDKPRADPPIHIAMHNAIIIQRTLFWSVPGILYAIFRETTSPTH